MPSADSSRALRFALTKSDVISPHTCWAVCASCALKVMKKPGIPRDWPEGIGLIPIAFLRHIDAVVHVGLSAGIQVESLDDRLNARTAQDLLLHRRQARAQIFIDDGLHIVFRNLLLLDQHQRLRHDTAEAGCG